MTDHYVLFLDVLGFADQVESLSDREFEVAADYWARRAMPSRIDPAYQLAKSFESFNRKLGEYLGYAIADGVRKRGQEFQAFVFSDSCYVVSKSAQEILSLARYLMVVLIGNEVAVRAGIGAGTFATLDITNKRTSTGHHIVMCPFAGSAVISAYRAESSGLIGLRCFIHPVAFGKLPQPLHEQILPLEPDETCKHASHELDFFDPNLDELEPPLESLLRSIDVMRKTSDERFASYYLHTEHAIDRMVARHDFG